MTADPGIDTSGNSDRTIKEVIEAADASDLSRAGELASAALHRGLQHPALFHARALWFEQLGRYREALADFESVRAHFPRNPELLNRIGNCLMRLSRWHEAIAALDSAIAMAPTFARAHYARGNALGTIGDDEAMQRAHERAVTLRPNYADALGSLAMIAIEQNNIAAAREYAGRALSANPRQHTAIIALAMIDIAGNAVAAAEGRLHTVLDDPTFGTDIPANGSLGILADAFDQRDRIEAAFAAYATLNMKRRAIFAARFQGTSQRKYAARLTAYLENSTAWIAPRPKTPHRRAADGHVFLLGFPRSGTTLLETVLAANTKVVALDEEDCLLEASRTFLLTEGGLDRLAALNESEIDRWQRVYWKSVQDLGLSVAGKVFVDKSPFRSLELLLIAKLFPEAKVLFALRDPRDVVLSCFRHRFEMNSANFEFLRLDDAAQFYSAVMRLIERSRERLQLDLREHRYENMVADFDSGVRAICNFIGVDWSETMRDFSHAADSTINIRSSSAAQVRRGLYRSGMGQWRRYRKQLAPVLPILQPWVERYGYPSE